MTAGIRRTGKSRHLIFWLYFTPFIIVFIAMIVMDLLSGGFYLVDYFVSLGVNGLMRLMGIENEDQMRPILEQVTVSTRSLPSIIMFAATSKCLILLLLNIFIAFMFPAAVWQVCKENEEIVKTIRSVDIQQQQAVATVSSPEHNVNVRVSPIESENNTSEVQPQTSYDPQPPYNPHLNGSKKLETRF